MSFTSMMLVFKITDSYQNNTESAIPHTAIAKLFGLLTLFTGFTARAMIIFWRELTETL
ncbi:MAG TPA: hypothetical protein V6D25_22780 [Leptolyngbyaceae cyanobacterium]